MESVPQNSDLSKPVSPQIETISERLYLENKELVYQQTDKLFSYLLIVQWVVGLFSAFFIAPHFNNTVNNSLYLIILATLFSVPAILVGNFRSGKNSTRYIIAISQMANTSLILDAAGYNTEAHFYILGSIVLLAMYRDWKLPLLASLFVVADHILRNIFYLNSFISDTNFETIKWLEHSAWLLIVNIFLLIVCLKRQKKFVSQPEKQRNFLKEKIVFSQ